MKTGRALLQKKTWEKIILGAAAFVLAFSFQVLTGEAASGKVIADTAKIRSEASTGSDVVGSTKKGATIEILEAVKGSDGEVWYKVSVSGGYGYIRNDLVETSDNIKVTENNDTPTASSENTSKPADTTPSSIDEKKATIAQSSVRVRSGASTSHDAVASLKQGTEITLIGEATDSAGNKWYQMTANKDGKTIEGYVRSDLITISEGGDEGQEDENADGEDAEGAGDGMDGNEGNQPEPENEHLDYEVVYNEDTYWLYDNINGNMMSVTNLLDVVNQANTNTATLQKQVKNEKIIIIVLAVIIVFLVVGATFLAIKLKDAYYYEYEEEEEEEPEPEPEVRKKKKQPAEDVEYQDKPARKERQEAELQAAEEKKPAKKTRKSQNFLVDDDEFEFEFLNMDDKDL